MSEQEKKQEEQVFDQELSVEDLDAAAGGVTPSCGDAAYMSCGAMADRAGCTDANRRPIYGPDGNQFPFCAATVEEDSMCWSNDGCKYTAVVYEGMRSCSRAHS